MREQEQVSEAILFFGDFKWSPCWTYDVKHIGSIAFYVVNKLFMGIETFNKKNVRIVKKKKDKMGGQGNRESGLIFRKAEN